MAEKIGLKAVLDTSNFTKGEQIYTSGLKSMGAQTTTQASKINTQLASIGKSFAGFAKFAAPAVAAGGIALAKESIELAQIQAKAEAQLVAAIKSTGGAAGLTATQLKTMASELQGVTNYGDEATIKAQALLLTFTSIGNDVFPRALTSILDVSTAMGQDLQTSTIQIGKALNEPIAGLSALRRVGIQFTDQQEQQIRTMVEAGRVTDAQNIILAELERQFGGSAAAAREADGNFIAASNAIGDLKEVIGAGLIPAMSDLNEITIEAANGWIVFINNAQLLGQAMDETTGQTGTLTKSLTKILKATNPMINVVARAGEVQYYLGEGLQSAADWFINNTELGQNYASILAEVTYGTESVADASSRAVSPLSIEAEAAIKTAQAYNQLALAQQIATNRVQQMGGIGGRDPIAEQEDPTLKRIRENRKELFDLQTEASQKAASATRQAATQIENDFESALNSLKGTIQQNIQPTLQEVWQPGGDEARIDENARRLATVSAAGFGSEWLNQLNTQFAGQDFWQPISQAIQAGDEGALKAAANDILANNVSALWDVELIKTRVRNDLKQQQLTQEIINTIAEEMAAEGNLQIEGFTSVANTLASGITQGVDDTQDEFEDVGASTIEGILKGMKKEAPKVTEFIKSIMQDAIKDAKREIGFGSPAKEFVPLGDSIVQGLLRGMSINDKEFKSQVKALVNPKKLFANRYSKSFHKGFTNFWNALDLTSITTFEKFNAQVQKFISGSVGFLKPNRAEIQKFFNLIKSGLGDVTRQLQSANLGQALSDTLSFGAFGQSAAARLGQEINQLRVFIREGGEFTTIGDNVIMAADAQDVLNAKLEQQVGLQQELQQIAKSQAELNFLQQQLQLLDLIRERGLNARDIFGDITFGLNASIPDLVTATSRVVQAMTSQINSQIAGTISGGTALVAGSTTNTATQNVNINVGSINNGMDMAQFTQSVQRVVAGAF